MQSTACEKQAQNSKAVQGTNDSSIVSKLSMCNAGYFVDPFLKHFVSKQAKRAPLINRGYYVRAKAVDHVLTTFLSHFSSTSGTIQIISLGAGFDSTYFRLMAQGRLQSNCKFFEVDFPSTVDSKLSIIRSSAELTSMITNPTQKAPSVMDSTTYTLIGCDLRHLTELTQLLKLCRVDYSVPTCLLSECVLTYMEPQRVDDLLMWSARSFQNAMFCTYEQIHPNDAFGLIMQEHFLSLHSPLRNINHYPSRASQEKRYRHAGWSESASCSMNDFFHSIPLLEQQRVDYLELFDEFEGWHLKCGHYTMLCACQGQCSAWKGDTLPRETVGCDTHRVPPSELDVLPAPLCNGAMLLSRFAHCSVEVNSSGQIVVAGGFGCSSGSGPHTRLEDVALLRKCHGIEGEGKWECVQLETTGRGPGRLMYQTATFVPSLDLILFYGGRGSPSKASGSCHSLRLTDSQALWEEVELDRASQIPQPRWRHTTTLVSHKGVEALVVTGGRSVAQPALDDCYLLTVPTWSFQKLDIVLPEGRHSHCVEPYKDSVIIAGGLTASMQPLSSCLQLQFTEEASWTITALEFEHPLPARYGMGSCISGDTLWLLGGVQLTCPSAGLLKVDLLARKWVEFGVMPTVGGRPLLLHGHTCHIADGELLILGGGGNCFSFGTHINDTACIALGSATRP